MINIASTVLQPKIGNKKNFKIFSETRFGRNALGRTKLHRRQQEENIPQLERCIMTKSVALIINFYYNDTFRSVS